jgi:hypothetical protein
MKEGRKHGRNEGSMEQNEERQKVCVGMKPINMEGGTGRLLHSW